MQLVLAECPACHNRFPNIFCNNPDLMIYNNLQIVCNKPNDDDRCNVPATLKDLLPSTA